MDKTLSVHRQLQAKTLVAPNKLDESEFQDTSSSVAIHLNAENNFSRLHSSPSFCLDLSQYTSDQTNLDQTDMIRLDLSDVLANPDDKSPQPQLLNPENHEPQQGESEIIPGSSEDMRSSDTHRSGYGIIDLALAKDLASNFPNRRRIPEDTLAENSIASLLARIYPQELFRIELSLPEARLHLHRTILFNIAIIIFSVSFLLHRFNIDYFTITLIAPTIYSIMFIYFEITRTGRVLGRLWFESGDAFKTFDAFNFLILVIFVILKTYGWITHSLYAIVPIFLSAGMFFMYVKKDRVKIAPVILRRFYYVVQAIPVLMKVDNDDIGSWALLMLPTWIYPGIEMFEYLNFLLPLLYRVCTESHPGWKTKLIGFTWHFADKLMVSAAIMTFLGFLMHPTLSGDDSEWVLIAIGIFVAINLTLILIAVLAKRQMIIFLLRLRAVDSHIENPSGEEVELKDLNEEVSFEIIKEPQFFVMHSPTWFLRLYDSIYVRGGGLEHYDSFISVRNTKDTDDISFIEDNRPTVSLDDLDWVTEKHEREKYQLDKENTNSTDAKTISNEQDDKLCYICCINPSNAAMSYCGHGGICFECGVTHLKQKQECMQCREEVQLISKIDPKPVFDDIFKATECYRIVKG